jgi:hypothetical protein
MQGRRVYPNSETGLRLQPGDYAFFEGIWYGESPNGHVCNLANHKVTEHEDGTITVSPSIGIYTDRSGQFAYHGFLERGVWRDA